LTRRAAALAALALALGAGCGGPSRPAVSGEVISVAGGTASPYGTGAGRAWLLLPRKGEIRSVVVYVHGWDAYLPFDWHQEWFEHLLRRGSAVIFPAYQDGIDDSFVVTPYDLRDGLTLGFRALRRPELPVVVAGFSVGGMLAFEYAARAREWGLPRPRAVLSIFPVDPYQIDPSIDLSDVRGIPVVLRAGDHDDVVGRLGADAFAALLGAGEKGFLDYRIVRSGKHVWADHYLPTLVFDPAVRRLFWAPLDRLVEEAQRAPR
jgi:pimeloyl-ACP methyl ester carboxylesterase